MRTDLKNIPKRNWNKQLEMKWEYRGKTLRLYSVDPQAHLIATTMPVGLLEDFAPDSVLVKAFEKNYKTEPKPGVVSKYGFEQAHGEPIEFLDYVYECIYDRACEAEMNRYRHNSKNYESGRYVDYIKHGLTIVIPEDIKRLGRNHPRYEKFIYGVGIDLEAYYDVLLDAEEIIPAKRKQHARRRLGFYVAVESIYKCNLRSLCHMGRQRSAVYSPNGIEAEPQISDVVTQMIDQAMPFLKVFNPDVLEQIGKGYH